MISDRLLKPVFRLAVYVKGIDGVLECVAGIGLAWLNPNLVLSAVVWLIQYETARHQHDLVIKMLTALAQSASMSMEKFFGLFLLAHGAVKVIFVFGLLRNKAWAYPFTLAATAFFISYEIYRLSQTQSLPLMIFTLFDVLFIVLVACEYWRRVSASTRSVIGS